MGMQQKLDRARQEGFDQGQKQANEFAEIRGHIKGAMETWELMEQMFLEIEGIGPKTKEKILIRIKEYATREKKRLSRGL